MDTHDDGKEKDSSSWYPGKYLVKAANYASSGSSSSSSDAPALGTLEPAEMDDLYPEPYIPHPEEDVTNIIKATSKATVSPSVFGPNSSHSMTGSNNSGGGRRSSWLSPFSSSETNGMGGASAEDPKINEKIESIICRLVSNVRVKCLSRKLEGSFTISRETGNKTATTCTLNAEEELSEGEDAIVCGDNADAMVLTANILDSLEQRSETWQSIDFKEDIKLTGGGKVNISDGPLNLSDFAIRIEITASVVSLLNNKKKRMMSRASVAKGVNPMTGSSGGHAGGGRSSII